MRRNTRSELDLAWRNALIVRFKSAFEPGTFCGYVLDIGPKFFLLLAVSDGLWFNGFQCFRLRDIRKPQVPDKFAAFHEAVLRKRKQWVAKKPAVSVASIERLLLSANRAFPLVTIHRDVAAHGVCYIGRVVRMRKGRVILREIGPGATWDDHLESYRVREITRVDFGGDYEDALHIVGGAPGALKRR